MISGLIFLMLLWLLLQRDPLEKNAGNGIDVNPQDRNLKATMRHFENVLAGGQKFQRSVTSDFPQIVNERLCLELFFTALLRAGDWLLVGSIDLPVPGLSYLSPISAVNPSLGPQPSNKQLYDPSFPGTASCYAGVLLLPPSAKLAI